MTVCGVDEFRCSDNRQCIPAAFRCNLQRDCMDGSDEERCGMLQQVIHESFSQHFYFLRFHRQISVFLNLYMMCSGMTVCRFDVKCLHMSDCDNMCNSNRKLCNYVVFLFLYFGSQADLKHGGFGWHIYDSVWENYLVNKSKW